MSKGQMLRVFVNQRLSLAAEEIFDLFERTIAEYEEQLCRSKEENERQRKLLDAVFKPQLRLHRADVQQLPVRKEEADAEQQDQEDPPELCHIKTEQKELGTSVQLLLVSKGEFPSERQEWSSSVNPPELPHIREEQEERLISAQLLLLSKEEFPSNQQEWSSSLHQEDPPELPHIKEELGTNQEEADIMKFTFTPVPVKNGEDEEKPQSSLLHQGQTEEMETEAVGEDCGGPGPAKNSDPDTHSQRGTEDKTNDSSEAETDDSDEWKESTEHRPSLRSKKNNVARVSDVGFSTGKKSFSCSECDKIFSRKASVTCHRRNHTREKQFSCSVCDKRFTKQRQARHHKCGGHQRSKPHQRKTELMETRADGEVDCGGPEPARNSDPDRHLQPETEDKPSDSAESVTVDGMETRGPHVSASKPLICSDCGETFKATSELEVHMTTHTVEKPYSCSFCSKRFMQKRSLKCHLANHTGEKPFSCTVCDKRFAMTSRLREHQKLHTREKSFKCSICNKAFHGDSHRQIHMRIHTGEKPYSCSICSHRSARKGSLMSHMRVHTREKPYSCSVCSTRFAWRYLMKQHKCSGESSQAQQPWTRVEH